MNWWGWMIVAWLAMSVFTTAFVLIIISINDNEGEGNEDEL